MQAVVVIARTLFEMKMKILLSTLTGACFGAIFTFFVMRDDKPTSTGIAMKSAEKLEVIDKFDYSDPFAFDSSTGETSGHPQGDTKMDMTDPTQRDICISLWYSDMNTVVDNLELHTGHKFSKEVGKIYASPEEILEEQAVFMKDFKDETERITSKQ